jgi:toxin ParE1/3/4
LTLPIVWLRTARADVIEAATYYSDIRPELRKRFTEAVDRTVQSIAATPLRFAVVDLDVRRASVLWSYSLFFFVEATRVVIVACHHAKRDPKHWLLRKR